MYKSHAPKLRERWGDWEDDNQRGHGFEFIQMEGHNSCLRYATAHLFKFTFFPPEQPQQLNSYAEGTGE